MNAIMPTSYSQIDRNSSVQTNTDMNTNKGVQPPASQNSGQSIPTDSLGNPITEGVVATISPQAQALQTQDQTIDPDVTPEPTPVPPETTTETSTEIRTNPKVQFYAQYKNDTVYMNEVQLLLDTQTQASSSADTPVYLNDMTSINGTTNNNVDKMINNNTDNSDNIKPDDKTAIDYLADNPDARAPIAEISTARNEKNLIDNYMTMASA